MTLTAVKQRKKYVSCHHVVADCARLQHRLSERVLFRAAT